VYAYLERHRGHIDYATYKALGLPLGSGMVESACKWLIQRNYPAPVFVNSQTDKTNQLW
jgi:hypothetical protein